VSPATPKRVNSVERRNAWRAQEQQLVERWNSAMESYRAIQSEFSARGHAEEGGASADELARKAQAALAEIAAVRRQVARLKREFLSGARY
jgi:hypothetical protein